MLAIWLRVLYLAVGIIAYNMDWFYFFFLFFVGICVFDLLLSATYIFGEGDGNVEGKHQLGFDIEGTRETYGGETVTETVLEVSMLTDQEFLDECFGGDLPEGFDRRLVEFLHKELFPDGNFDF